MILLILSLCLTISFGKTHDIVIVGGTPSGIAAAISACTINPDLSILLLEGSDQIGGMASAGGIGLRDFSQERLLGGSMLKWARMNAEYYSVDYPVWQPDNFVGNHSFWSLLKQECGKQIVVKTNQKLVLGGIQFYGKQIISLKTSSGEIWYGKQFIDASYEGDLIRFSGIDFTFGRESKQHYGEQIAGIVNSTFGDFDEQRPINAEQSPGVLLKYVNRYGLDGQPGYKDKNVMGYSFRLCVTRREENQVPFRKPKNYQPEDFEIFRRYYQAGYTQLPFKFLPYRNYPQKDKFDVCNDWTGNPLTTDPGGLNYGFPNGTVQERLSIEKEHRYFIQGLFHFLLHDPSVPLSLQDEVKQYGLCKDEWPEKEHFPIMYIREGIRLIGDNVFTQTHIDNKRRICRTDTIALGQWWYDIHIMQRFARKINNSWIVTNEGAIRGKPSPIFEIPYSVLLPKKEQVSNLLASVCSSVSHVAFASLRIEPVLWQLGQASGIAAALALNQNVSVVNVPTLQIQQHLQKQGNILHWPLCITSKKFKID